MANTLPTEEASGTLLRRTVALLRKDKRSLYTISRESGLPFYWLKKVSSGEIKEPTVNKTQRLFEFLSNRKLPV